MKHGRAKETKTKRTIKTKKSKKFYIVIISALLAVILFASGGFVVWNYISRPTYPSNPHIQIPTQVVEENEKILIQTETGQQPVYIDAIEGMPRNMYDDNNFTTNDYGYKQYSENGKVISKVGIDVSYVQGDINWEEVKKSGVDYAIIRCGGRGYGNKGVLYEDEKFKQNIENATDAGIDVGVYFFSQAITVEEAKEEAQYTLDLIKDYSLKYPVVFDWEYYDYDNARTDNIDRETLTKIARKYCTIVENAGYTPMIYANRSLLYYTYDLAKLADIEIWLASYDDVPDYYYNFGMWQYSTEGTLNGIEGNVDLNVCMYKY